MIHRTFVLPDRLRKPDGADFKQKLGSAAFAFRGYNVTNLGRSRELLNHPAYGKIVKEILSETSSVASELTGRRVDLLRRVRRNQETTLATFGDAVCLIMAMEVAQIRLLKEFFGIAYDKARSAMGYSLGEVSAVVCGGVITLHDAIKIPLSLAGDAAELGRRVTMGIVFSRAGALDHDEIRKLCLEINTEGKGVIGISSLLSPNSLLVLGQEKTVDRFKKLAEQRLPQEVHLRKNKNRWPPLHTPIMWQHNVPNRAGVMMHTIPGGFGTPHPPILSMVTGKASYNDFNCRELLTQWIDHPQRVWDVVYETLGDGIETVIHVGPEPNLFPATFKRLGDNIRVQLSGTSPGSLGLRMVSGMARRPWLTAILPSRAALLRAPFVEHVILEEWLLEQEVP